MDHGGPAGVGGSSPHTRGAPAVQDRRGRRRRIIPAYAGSTWAGVKMASPMRDHPRIRGEHAPVVEVAGREPGSSPHTRGALFGRPVCGRSARIIPAYAGSTARRPPNLRPSADHPRIRGEHVAEMFKFPDHPGSSPHTRGAQKRSDGPDGHERIIPAYAGSTAEATKEYTVTRDHPRIRGEHVYCYREIGFETRIIPAYAGSTEANSLDGQTMADHPRIRGEHLVTCISDAKRAGSSPHTRGARDCRRRRGTGAGIIPAYAGSTPSASPPPAPRRDHPRIRGEHILMTPPSTGLSGSSPHTRGAQGLGEICDKLGRIIPAYAGSTGWPKHHIQPHPDHPRIRGEHVDGVCHRFPDGGSSPHTRGARDLVGVAGINSGIIPAYAGSTRPI